MKKTLILCGATALVMMGAGYGAATVLAPPAPETADVAPHAADPHEADPHGDPHAGDAAAAPYPLEDHGRANGDHIIPDPYEIAADTRLVRIGQVIVPVEQVASVGYVVADLAIKTASAEAAQALTRVEAAVRMRDILLTRMHTLAEGPILRGVTLDDAAIARDLTAALQPEFPGVDDILFVTLLKQHVPRM